MNNQILLGLVTIGLVASVVGVGTYAYFSDTETSTGNTMEAGVLDLKLSLDREIWEDGSGPIAIIEDMKPSYEKWSNPIYLMIVDNPGKLYKRLVLRECYTGETPEPELTEGDTTNDLTRVTEWTLKVNGEEIAGPLLLSTIGNEGWVYLGTFDGLEVVMVEQMFHMIDEAGNEYQGDYCEFDEEFMVLQWNDPSMEPVLAEEPVFEQ